MADPFSYLIANLNKPVTVRVANGDRVHGVLLSLDDFNNVLLGEWAVTPAAGAGGVSASSATGADAKKRAKRSRVGDEADGPSIRFIRGSEVRSISFSTAATVEAAAEE